MRIYLFLIISLWSLSLSSQCEESLVLTDQADTLVQICPMDGEPDVITMVTSSDESENYDFILTNQENEILLVMPISTIDFDGFPVGVCRIWGVSYDGELVANTGDVVQNIFSTGVCIILSENFVEIVKSIPNGGLIDEISGLDLANVCTGDATEDYAVLLNSGNGVQNYSYFLLNTDSVVLDISFNDSIALNGLASGNYLIGGIAYNGDLQIAIGDTFQSQGDLAAQCYELSENMLSVNTVYVGSGLLSDINGRTELFACADNGNPDVFEFTLSDSSAQNHAIVITDQSMVILDILSGSTYDFEGQAGVCLVWAIGYSGSLLIDLGDVLGDPEDVSTSCADIADEPVVVNKDVPVKPFITDEFGEEVVLACPGDGRRDIVFFKSENEVNGFLQLIITLPNGLIIGSVQNDFIDFENVGPGECWVWGLSYTGALGVQVGTFLDENEELSDDCFALSDNHVTIQRIESDGAMVSTDDGEDFFYSCPQDGEPDILSLINSSDADADYGYILTNDEDEFLRVIDGASIDLDTFSAGECRVYGVSYLGDLTIDSAQYILEQDSNGIFVNLATVCSDLSDNYIEIQKRDVDGGMLFAPGDVPSAYLCTEEGSNTILEFTSDSEANSDYGLIITNENDIVIQIPNGMVIDFANVPAAECKIYGVSYTGDLIVETFDILDENLELSNGCFELSENFIEVFKDDAEGATVSFSDTSELFTVCNGDGVPDLTGFRNTSSSTLRYEYLLLNQNFELIDVFSEDTVDFDAFQNGICVIMGVSYSGALLYETGDVVTMNPASDDCWDLSENFIILNKIGFAPPTLETIGGETAVFVCPSNPGPKVYSFDIDNPDGNEALILYDEESIVRSISEDGIMDFDTLEEGICFLQSLWYFGSLNVEIGDTLDLLDELATSCAALSTNIIDLIRVEPQIGNVINLEEKDSLIICPGDGLPNFLRIGSDEEILGNFASVITTPDSLVLNVSTRDSFDLDLFPEGECLIWGLAYTGNLLIFPGANLQNFSEYSDDCSDLSNNSLYILKEVPVAGTIFTDQGLSELELCVGDGSQDIVRLATVGREASQFVHLIVDADGVILGINAADSLDLENAGAGNCKIYGLAYTGDLLISLGNDIDDVDDLSDDCWDLSSNFVQLNRYESESASISVGQSDSVYYSCIDFSPDVVELNVFGGEGSRQSFILCNSDGIIEEIQEASEINLDEFGVGVYEIKQVYHAQDLDIMIGEVFDPLIIDDEFCAALSVNSITVFRDTTNGGIVSSDGVSDTISLCGDGDEVLLYVENNSTSILNYVYLLMNENNVIQLIANSSGLFNVSDLNDGTYRVLGISYTGALLVSPGDIISNQDLSAKCFETSVNTLILDYKRPLISSFNVGGQDSIKLCLSQEGQDSVRFDVLGEPGLSRILVAVSDAGIVLDIFNETTVPSDAFEAENCTIYAVSYDGDVLDVIGLLYDPESLIDGCYDISDEIVYIEKIGLNSGQVTTIDGESSIDICVSDGIFDIISFENTGENNPFYSYVVTDQNDVISQFSPGNTFIFPEGLAGTCHVYGLAHQSQNLNVNIGQNIFDNNFSASCYSLSEGFVTVNKFETGAICMVSTEQVNFDDVYVYPNPNTGDFLIRNASDESLEYRLYNMEAIVLESGLVPIGMTQNLERGLVAGVYILQLTSGTETVQKRILVID